MRRKITSYLDFFYPLVKRFIPKETYYYAACGSVNLVLSWILFFIFYQFLYQKRNIEFKFYFNEIRNITISAYTLSSFTTFCFSFSIGFLLNRYIVFTQSDLKANIQLFRYGLSALISYGLSWVLLKFLIETMSIFPSIANIMASCIVVVFSFIMQRKFTFR